MASRGIKRLKLRDLSRQPLSPEERAQMRDMLLKMQPAIITAIIGQSFVENDLDDLLRPRFHRNDDASWEMLTDDHGPLSTFDAKITTGFAFGIYTETIRDCLKAVRDIRNAFAHSRKPLDFSHELVIKRLSTVPLPTSKRSNLYKELSKVRAFAKAKDGAQVAYILLCFTIGANLLERKVKRLHSKSHRLTKKRRTALARALMDYQPKHKTPGLLSHFLNQSGDPK